MRIFLSVFLLAFLFVAAVNADDYLCPEYDQALELLKKGKTFEASAALKGLMDEYPDTEISRQSESKLREILRPFYPEKIEVADGNLSRLEEKKDADLETLIAEYKKAPAPSEKYGLAGFLLGKRRLGDKDYFTALNYLDLSRNIYSGLAGQQTNAVVFKANYRKASFLYAEAARQLCLIAFNTPGQWPHFERYARYAEEAYRAAMAPARESNQDEKGLSELAAFQAKQIPGRAK